MHFHMQVEIEGADTAIQKEYARHQEHLERSLTTMKKKLALANMEHNKANVKIMQVWW